MKRRKELMSNMPNYCEFTMKVGGLKKGVRQLGEMLKYEHPEGLCFYRILEMFNADVNEKALEYSFIEEYFSGECAWSVEACMLNTENSYHKKSSFSNPSFKYTDLATESYRLSLEIEVYSLNAEEGIQEHYYIKDGEFIISEVIDVDVAFDYNIDNYVVKNGFNTDKYQF